MPFNTALSGIRAANSDLRITGNNIANASTVGFKSSRAEFGDVYATTLLGGGANSIGSGVQLQAVSQQFGQGNLNFTENELDLSISGGGFFIVSQAGDRLFTRAGTLGLDSQGYIVTNTSARLQGFAADSAGNIGGVLGDLQILANTQPPAQTTLVNSQVNLDSNEAVLQSTGSTFSTDGSVIGVAQTGQSFATTTTLDVGAVATPIDFTANPTTFDLQLTGSTPATGNGTVSLNLNGTTANSLQDIANLINNAIFSSPSPINVQAIANGGSLELQDLNSGVSSNINLSNITGVNALSTALGAAPASTAGVAAADNGYGIQTLEIVNPDGQIITYNSNDGVSAAQTASELNALAGITASATTTGTIASGTFDNSNSNLVLNGVTLLSTTLAGLATEINSLSSTTLPGVSALINGSGDLELTSSVGDDLIFSFSGAGVGQVDILGRPGTGTQTVTNTPTNQSGVVGGSINIVLQENYTIASSTPTVGNLFAPFNSTTFQPLTINAFSPTDQATYNHATSVTIYDSLGNPHIMTQYFVKQPYDVNDPTTQPNHWRMHIQIDGQDVGDPNTALPPPQNTVPTPASYDLYFNPDGSLNTLLTPQMLVSNWTPLDSDGNPNGALQPLNVLQGGSIPVPTPALSSNFQIDMLGTTQFGSVFAVNSVEQTGYTTGRLSGLDVDETGIIFARFTNGEAQVLGQIALADFNNVQGLQPTGNTMWAETFETGAANIGTPGSSSLGGITSGALEESNVDLSAQLVNLIIAQRNFQASAKTIETANQTTQTIINI
ncbi:hypothetical protein NBRC116494_26330 [Aurantivibrio plasticivorans]